MKNFLESFREIEKLIIKNKILLALDYDGTLTRIRKEPETAVLSKEMKKMVSRMVDRGIEVVIISGRTYSFLSRQFQDLKVRLVAEHGLRPSKFSGELTKCLRIIENEFGGQKGVRIERKTSSFTVHFRNASKKMQERVEISLPQLLIGKKIVLIKGKKIFDVLQSNRNKGDVVKEFERMGYFVIFLGDDSTDENAFKSIRNGFGVIVLDKVRRSSNADYYVEGLGGVRRALGLILSSS